MKLSLNIAYIISHLAINIGLWARIVPLSTLNWISTNKKLVIIQNLFLNSPLSKSNKLLFFSIGIVINYVYSLSAHIFQN